MSDTNKIHAELKITVTFPAEGKQLVELDKTGCMSCAAHALALLLKNDPKFKAIFNQAARIANGKDGSPAVFPASHN